LIARRTAEDSETPFLNVQDGFLTTHTIENVPPAGAELMKMFIGHPSTKLRNLMDPRVPLMSGVVQNQDSYMKGKIAQRKYYDRVLPTLKSVMDEYGRLTGRKYDVVMPYRLDDADYAIVGSGLHDGNGRGRCGLYSRAYGSEGRPAAYHVFPSVSLH
jgi:pyruvate-ferredoxin/flavodoxin oxidoreductase